MFWRWATLAVYTLIGLIGALGEARCLATGRPDLVQYLRLLAARPLQRIVLLAGWAWLGWHLFVRGST